jgi:hypothetical protein
MSEDLKQHILKNGFTLGVVYICIDILKYLGGAEYFVNTYVGVLSILIAVVVPIYYTFKFRASNEGFIDFRTAFSSCTGILLAAGFIELVFQILLLNIIDTQFASELLDVSINTAVAQFEAFGMSEDEITKIVTAMESTSSYSPMNMLKGFGFMVVGYTIFGLIVAAFTKNDRPEFSEE